MYTPGMRTVKSAVAVLICLCIGTLRGESGMPFYSAIAAVLCMQPDIVGSLKTAAQRTLATLIGGFMGLMLLLLERYVLPPLPLLLHYVLVAVAIIPLIHMTVMMKKTDVSYVTCVVFLSVVISHASDLSPLLFSVNRMLDTLIGIVVSLLVNIVEMPGYRNMDVLFVSDMDGTLLDDRERLTSSAKRILNRVLARGGRFTVASARSPATLVPLLEGVELRMPIVALGGAVLYDVKNSIYHSIKTIPHPIVRQVLGVFSENGRGCFTHIIRDNHLYIYHRIPTNQPELLFMRERQNLELKTYCEKEPPLGEDVVYFSAIDRREIMERICRAVMAMPCADELGAIVYDANLPEGYATLEIFRADASKQHAVAELSRLLGVKKTVAFGDNLNDLGMLKAADYGFAVKNANPEVLSAIPLHTRGDNNHCTVPKTILGIFGSRSFFTTPPEKLVANMKRRR